VLANIIVPIKVVAQSTVINCRLLGNDPNNCQTGLPHVSDTNGGLQLILTWVFSAVALIAVLVIAFSALRLIFAARDGDPQALARMRSTIVYAAVGLVIALLADSIVGFVAGWL
jgi:hypothetical protein